MFLTWYSSIKFLSDCEILQISKGSSVIREKKLINMSAKTSILHKMVSPHLSSFVEELYTCIP